MDRGNRYRDPGVRDTIAWASGITFLAGLWLIVSSFLFGPFAGAGGGSWNSLIVGIVIAVLAAWRATAAFDAPGLSGINAVLGAWMIAAPFVLAYMDNPGRAWSSIIAGFIIVISATQSATALPESEHETYTTRSAYDAATSPSRLFPYMWPYAYGGSAFGPAGWPPEGTQGWRREDVGAPGQYRGRGPRGWRRTDEQIHQAIAERMADNGDLDASEIDMDVRDGIVTLRGAVSSRSTKRLAEDIAESVGGVEDVRNEIRVRGDRAPGVRRAA